MHLSRERIESVQRCKMAITSNEQDPLRFVLRESRTNYEVALVQGLKTDPKKFFAYAGNNVSLRIDSDRVVKLMGNAGESAAAYGRFSRQFVVRTTIAHLHVYLTTIFKCLK